MFKKIYLMLGAFLLLLQHDVRANFQVSLVDVVIQYEILCIDTFSISGNPGPLVIMSSTAGGRDFYAEDSTTTYAITTNNTGRRMTAVLASNMPHGTSLSVCLVPPKGATPCGFVDLSATPMVVASGISNLAQGSLGITYRFHATTAAAKVAGALNIVTYTVGP